MLYVYRISVYSRIAYFVSNNPVHVLFAFVFCLRSYQIVKCSNFVYTQKYAQYIQQFVCHYICLKLRVIIISVVKCKNL